MNKYFTCKNGQNISWTSVCDGYHQCLDGSDEQNCYCQGDVYGCLQGNNVSCKIACATYGRVTCLTYQNKRACEQYIHRSTTIQSQRNTTGESIVLLNDFDGLRYSAYLAIGILIFVSFISLIIYLIRKNSFHLLNRKFSNRLSSISHQPSPSSSSSQSRYTIPPDIHDLPPSYHYSEQNIMSANDCYEPPPYPGLSTDSNYYETIKIPSMSMLHPMPLPEPFLFNNIRTHCV